MSQTYLVLDYETRSEADLKKTGGFEYGRHPTTEILCAAWRLGTKETLAKGEVHVWSGAFKDTWHKLPGLVGALCDPNTIIVAHNALFEQVITRFVLPKYLRQIQNVPTIRELPHERWTCTAAQAAALALPRNLEGACLALNLPIKKDMEGRRLMMKYCKPRKATKNNLNKWHCDARELRRIMEYCKTDIEAETALFLKIPELNPLERKVWLLDQKINFRGFLADRDLVKNVLKMIDIETGNLNRETGELTFGEFEKTTQRDEVLKWLETQNVYLPDLKAKTVSDALKEGLATGVAKRMLEIRQDVSKTSTKKYQAFDIRSRSDGRVRDSLIYHAASTGRWGGAGVQPQNFPRGNMKNTTEAAEILRLGDLELVRLLYGNPMNVFSSCLRSVIHAPEGRQLYCGDWAAIEARVLFWIAKHEDGLKAFRENRPMYEKMAMIIYNLASLDFVTKIQRQVGKQAFLGCGYGMGWKKFLQTCKSFGIEIDEEIAQIAVQAYRSTHSPIVKLWSNIERAAIAAVRNPKNKYKINYTTWWVKDNFLWCELPSGRRLAYYGPEVKFEPTPWDEKRPVLYHWGVNSLTKKWESSGTYGGRLVENVIQAVSRDLMAAAMIRSEAAGYDITLSVHDELLAERNLGEGSVNEFENIMAELPSWASGCPVRVEGWSGPRYRK